MKRWEQNRVCDLPSRLVTVSQENWLLVLATALMMRQAFGSWKKASAVASRSFSLPCLSPKRRRCQALRDIIFAIFWDRTVRIQLDEVFCYCFLILTSFLHPFPLLLLAIVGTEDCLSFIFLLLCFGCLQNILYIVCLCRITWRDSRHLPAKNPLQSSLSSLLTPQSRLPSLETQDSVSSWIETWSLDCFITIISSYDMKHQHQPNRLHLHSLVLFVLLNFGCITSFSISSFTAFKSLPQSNEVDKNVLQRLPRDALTGYSSATEEITPWTSVCTSKKSLNQSSVTTVSVDCSSKSLTHVPSNLPKDLTHL